MRHDFPKEPEAKRAMLLDAVAAIGPTLSASGGRSEELNTLAPEAVSALRDAGIFKLKLASEMGGAEADPLTEMLVLEELAYHDLTSAWCTMVGATAIASLGTFLPQSGLDKVFGNGRRADRLDLVLSCGPGHPQGRRRLSRQRTLALQQRHPSCRMGAGRHGGAEQRQRQWRPHRHVLRLPREGRDAPRQLGRRDRIARHRLGRFLGAGLRPPRGSDLRVGSACIRNRCAADRPTGCRPSAMSPRSTAAWRSAAHGARSTNW